jgi:hypothetical protein
MIAALIMILITLLFIIKQNKTMGELNETITAKIAEIGVSIANIAGDVKVLTERGKGGLTKAEAEGVVAKLTVAADALKALDELTPAEPVEEVPPVEETPTEETPTEPEV